MAGNKVKKTKEQRYQERNDKIRNRYKFYDEVKKFKTEYILELLEGEFPPLLGSTIWLIVSETGYYKKAV